MYDIFDMLDVLEVFWTVFARLASIHVAVVRVDTTIIPFKALNTLASKLARTISTFPTIHTRFTEALVEILLA
jgi:hypothetical protein